MTEPASTLVSLQGIAKVFANGVAALADLDLDIRAGEFLSLLGPSGCGKSTVLRLVAGLTEPTRGRVVWPGSGAADHRGEIGFVFQDPTLMPWANVADNVWLPLRLRGVSRHDARESIAESLALVGLERFRESLSARTLRRHEDARVDRAGSFRQAAPAAHGRALRRPRRDHALPPQRRSAAAAERAALHDRVRDPFGLRERLSLEPHRDHVAAPRPHRRGGRRRGAGSADEGFSHRPALCRPVRRDLKDPAGT